MKGKFYGVSVGPGDPELMTLKAVRVLESCEVVATPETGEEKTLALDIAMGAADLSGKTILPLRFLMTRDKAELEASHAATADRIAQELEAGRDVAMLNLGDVSVFSTFSYILELILKRGYEAEVVPGVTSFCAVAAKLQISLTSMNSPLHIVPAGGCSLEEALEFPGRKVLMKAGKSMPRVKEALRAKGLYDSAMLIQNCGLPDEKICRSMDEADENTGYFSTIIVKE